MASRDIEVIGEGEHVLLVRQGRWEWARRKGATAVVGIVAVNGDGKIILVEQFRTPVGQRVIELPAGLVGDGPGGEQEEPLNAARRELLEETGYQAERMEYLGAGPPSAGLSDEVIMFFRAEGLTKVGPGGGDSGEDITVHEVGLGEIDRWLERAVSEGEVLIDPKVYAGLYMVVRQKGAQG